MVLRIGQTMIEEIHEYYSQVPSGQPLALFGSSGRLEIAVREGSAAQVLGLRKGAEVSLFLQD